jgi:hypothetical protein
MTPLLRLVPATLALAALCACAPMPAGPAEFSAGRTRVVLPSSAWEDLGTFDEVLSAMPQPASVPLQTRAMALRGARNEVLAVVLVQSHQRSDPRDRTLWTASCADEPGLWVKDAAAGSPVRVDCLRFKRWAHTSDRFLDKADPGLVRWMRGKGVAPVQPYSHLNYRYATEGGAYIEVTAVVDLRLLQLPAGNTPDYLRAGVPAQVWSEKMAKAARVSVGMADGFLAVPPFPAALPQ